MGNGQNSVMFFFSSGSKTVNDVNKLEVEFLASIVSTRLYFKLHLFPFCFGFLFCGNIQSVSQ